MDKATSDSRSRNMAAIKSKNTKPELLVRKYMHSAGFRYRLHRKDLPGKPDLYLPKYKTVIFIHGCFWHQHVDCRNAKMPKTNSEFWKNKLMGNVKRDIEIVNKLRNMDLKVIVVWECTIREHKKNNSMDKLIEGIKQELKMRKKMYIEMQIES